MHNFNEDWVCRRCGFDLVGWAHQQAQLPEPDYDAQPECPEDAKEQK